MPKWIHDRARHIQAKNPGMSEQVAFAVATQQSHKLKKSPKGYGTSEGKSVARAKFKKSRKSYTIGADPKGIGREFQKQLDKKASENPLLAEQGERKALPWVLGGAVAGSIAAAQDSLDPGHIGLGAISGALAMYAGSRMLSAPTIKEASSMPNAFQSTTLDAFTDELQKIAASVPVPFKRKAIDAVKKTGKRYGELLRGGAKDKPGLVGRMMGRESSPAVKSLTGRAEAAAAKASGQADKLKEIRMVQTARGATAVGAGALTVHSKQKHRKKDRRNLGRAYVTGARDMYGQMNR